MFLGKPLFSGCDEKDQMARIVAVLGMPLRHILHTSADVKLRTFFDGNMFTGWHPRNVKLRTNEAPLLPLRDIIMRKAATIPVNWCTEENRELDEDPEDYENFIELLHATLEYDPACRITPYEALSHPFFTSRPLTNNPPPAKQVSSSPSTPALSNDSSTASYRQNSWSSHRQHSSSGNKWKHTMH